MGNWEDEELSWVGRVSYLFELEAERLWRVRWRSLQANGVADGVFSLFEGKVPHCRIESIKPSIVGSGCPALCA